jgi:hypothetical protein
LTEDYLCRLVEGIEYSGIILSAERGVAPAVRGVIGRLADQLRIWRQQGPHRQIQRAAFRGRAAAIRWLAKSAAPAPATLPSPAVKIRTDGEPNP